MKSIILSVLAILLPSSLCSADAVKITCKVLETTGHKIPHDLAKADKVEGISILTLPSVLTLAGQEQEIVNYREFRPASVAKQEFDAVPVGTQIVVKQRLVDGKIVFTAMLTLSEMVRENAEEARTQTEFQSRTVYLSGRQENGEEVWFDLVDAVADNKNKKVTVWIRFDRVVSDVSKGVDPDKYGKLPGMNEEEAIVLQMAVE